VSHPCPNKTQHLHALLIDRAEAAATRILDLEKEICDLEDDILANESELRHLRLKIRAVETLCYEFVHPDADPELFRSIENWKADWVLVRDRMLERKKDRKERRIRLHRAGCVISSLEEREEESTLTSLAGLSMSVSMMGLGRSPRKAY
jgi:predicted  nucleic acid-binding Zn-ribbon protein